MASDGHLLVQWGKRGSWFAGKDADDCAAWTLDKRNARRFVSIAEFRAYEREAFPGLGRWLSPTHVRFIRFRSKRRKEDAFAPLEEEIARLRRVENAARAFCAAASWDEEACGDAEIALIDALRSLDPEQP